MGLLLQLVTLVFASAASAAPWLRLRSPHFVVVGDASERELRQVAARVEGFRAGLIRALPNATVAMPVPMTIVVFATDGGFTPYKPLVRGKPMERIAGYFLGGEDANFIAMTLASGDAAYPTILHEYTHALLSETLPAAPLWLHEGLAEVYSTYRERADGLAARVGAPPEHHVRELQSGRLMPLPELLAVDRGSPDYNEGDRRGLFYAQAWAFTHYLLLGNPLRRSQLPEYLRLLDDGAPVPDAMRRAFASDARVLEDELRDYARRFTLNGFDIALDPANRAPLVMTTERMSAAEAATYQVELLARLGRPEEARRAVEALLAGNPGMPQALAALGRLHVRAGRIAEALPLLRQAAAQLPDDAAVNATYARALVEDIRPLGTAAAKDQPRLTAVLRALEHAAALDPDDAFVVAMQGYMELLAGDDFDRAQDLLERAVRQAPARQEYHLLLAQVYLVQRNLAGVQRLAGPLVAHGTQPRIRDQARELLGRAAGDAGANTARLIASPAFLELRPLEAGEGRALGTFERIECRSDDILLHVRTAERPLALRTIRLDEIDFINYRDEAVPPMGCRSDGLPLPVVATWRDGTGAAPQGVAIEFVPADYRLP